MIENRLLKTARASLAFKIISVIFVSFFVLFLLTLFLSIRNLKNDLTEAFRERAEATSNTLQSSISSKEDIQNKPKLLLNIQKVMWLDTEIRSVNFNIKNEKNIETYASSNFKGLDKDIDPGNAEVLEKNTPLDKIIKVDGTDILRLIMPVYISGQPIGTTEIDFSLESVNVKIKRTMKFLIYSYLFLTFVYLGAVFLYIRFILIKPIAEINKGVEAVKKNDFTFYINISSQDELGNLANEFNVLSSKLHNSNKNLEKKIEERTKALIKSRENLLADRDKLDKSQKAIMNILEDVNESKISIEREKTKYKAERDRNEGILRYLHSIGEGIIATDTQGKIIFVNLTAAKLISRAEGSPLFGRKYSDEFSFVLGKGSSAKIIDPVEKVLESSLAYTLPPNCYMIMDNKHVPISGSFAPIVKDGKNLGVVGVFQDITERHNLEKEKDGFLSIAAHQLRTPLTGIRWTIESLLDGDAGKISKEAKTMLSQIFENNQRLIALVNDLLDVSRINMGKSKEDLVPVNICNILQESVGALSGFAKERKIEIVYAKVCAINPFVKAGPKHIFQAFENIISNAIKYTPIGGIVKASADYKKDKVIIGISDSGIGIPKEDQAKIFTKFFRASNAVLKETEGSGLGLSVVKSFIEEAGGKIWFESEEGKGTTFFIELPMA